MKCIHCNNEFKSKRKTAKFCSDKCRVAFSRVSDTANKQMGFVYLLKCGEFYKIGQTQTSVFQRIKIMETGNPYPISIVFVGKVINSIELERALHKCFGPTRKSGEWFSLTDEDIRSVINIIGKNLNLGWL